MSAGSAPASGLPRSIPTSLAAPAVVRVGTRTVLTAEPAEVLCLDGEAALRALDRLDHGWWAGFISFDLGRSIERITPRPLADVRTRTSDRRSVVPDLLIARYDARLEIDGSDARMLGSAPARRRLEHLLASAPAVAAHEHLGTATSSLSHDEYTEGVRAVLALLEAGDCYQVNLTRRLQWDATPDPVAMFHAVTEANPAPHGSLLVLPQPGSETIAIASASPERFLAWRTDATGRVVETRPIKGTGRNSEALRASAKNRAENVMIVDLARNDLGRVCEFGTIHVPHLCDVESHPGLWHLVSTVRGRLRDDVGIGGLVRATFPPASVTGAPKPRVLQAIEDLEPVRRGVYCGAVGWIDADEGSADLAVAIRTFVVAGDGTSLGVGSGIVADSDPDDEWRETRLKAARLLAAVGARDADGRDPN